MDVKHIFTNYDIRRMRPKSPIAFTHENDVNTRILEVHLNDGGTPLTLSEDYTYTAAIVNRRTNVLICDSVVCSLNESGNVEIPIDNLHVSGEQELAIELTVTDENNQQVLTLPFPLSVNVNGTILDTAEVVPDSEGTIPELLKAAKDAVENVENKQDKIIFAAPPAFPGKYEVGTLFFYNSKLYRYTGDRWNQAVGSYTVYEKIGRRITYAYNKSPLEYEDTTLVPSYDPGDLYVNQSRTQANNSLGSINGTVYMCTGVLFNTVSYGDKMRYNYSWREIFQWG